MPKELWTEVHKIVKEAVAKISPRKEMQEGKVVLWGGFTSIQEKKKWKAIEKEKHLPNWMQGSSEQQKYMKKHSWKNNAKK